MSDTTQDNLDQRLTKKYLLNMISAGRKLIDGGELDESRFWFQIYEEMTGPIVPLQVAYEHIHDDDGNIRVVLAGRHKPNVYLSFIYMSLCYYIMRKKIQNDYLYLMLFDESKPFFSVRKNECQQVNERYERHINDCESFLKNMDVE